MKNLELDHFGLTQLSLTEYTNTDGGDTNGLMHGGQDLPTFGYVVGFIAGLFNL